MGMNTRRVDDTEQGKCQYWKETGKHEKGVFGAELRSLQRKYPEEYNFLGRKAAKKQGNIEIVLSKQSFHPSVRGDWPTSRHSWVQWYVQVRRSPFLYVLFPPYLHYLVSEIPQWLRGVSLQSPWTPSDERPPTAARHRVSASAILTHMRCHVRLFHDTTTKMLWTLSHSGVPPTQRKQHLPKPVLVS